MFLNYLFLYQFLFLLSALIAENASNATGCNDRGQDCLNFIETCSDKESSAFLNDWCKKTCNLCNVAKIPCTDEFDLCEDWEAASWGNSIYKVTDQFRIYCTNLLNECTKK